jgi:hypothetical protein
MQLEDYWRRKQFAVVESEGRRAMRSLIGLLRVAHLSSEELPQIFQTRTQRIGQQEDRVAPGSLKLPPIVHHLIVLLRLG